MAPASGQATCKRAVYWNKGNGVQLKDHLNKKRIKRTARDIRDLDPFRKKYFPHITYKNFRVQFLKKSAQWETEQAKKVGVTIVYSR